MNNGLCISLLTKLYFKNIVELLSRVLKQITSIRNRKKEDSSDYTEAQMERVIRLTRKWAFDTFKDKFVILDDEKYFSLSNSKTPGYRGYYTDNISRTPTVIRFIKKVKFEPKVMVWLQDSGVAINAYAYINKCLKSNLLQFISKYH